MHEHATKTVHAYGMAILAVAEAILLRWPLDPLLVKCKP